MRITIRAVVAVMAAAVLVGGVGWIGLKLSGRQVLGVQTASMAPHLWPGDAVIVAPANARQLQPGQIVSFQSLANRDLIVTHRLIHVDRRTGWLTTKGDALSQPDPTFPPRLVVGRVVVVLPKLGVVLDALRRPLGLVGLIYLPAACIIVSELRRLQGVRQPSYRSRVQSLT